MGGTSLEIVLMRQLASCLAVPILIVDRHLDLVFFNESAEPILGGRFDETGGIQRAEWNSVFQTTDRRGEPIPPERATALHRDRPPHARASPLLADRSRRRRARHRGRRLSARDAGAGLVGAAGIFWPSQASAEPPSRREAPRRAIRSRHAVEVILLRRLAERLADADPSSSAEGACCSTTRRPSRCSGAACHRSGADPAARLVRRVPADRRGRLPHQAGRPPAERRAHPLQPCHRRFLYQGLDGTRRARRRDRVPAGRPVQPPPGSRRDLLGGFAMRVTLWGTRGSLAVAGPGDDAIRRQHLVRRGARRGWERARARCGDRDPTTGRRDRRRVERVDLLLTHLHMDHIQGLGFFEPLFRPAIEVHIWGPSSTTLDLRTRLSRYLSPPLFPVRLRDLPRQPILHDVGAALRDRALHDPGGAGLPSRTHRGLSHRSRRSVARVPPRSRARAGARRVPERPRLRARPRSRRGRRPADPRRDVHRGRVPAARRLGAQLPCRRARVCRSGARVPPDSVPPRSEPRRRGARSSCSRRRRRRRCASSCCGARKAPPTRSGHARRPTRESADAQ